MIIKAVENIEDLMEETTEKDKPPSARIVNRGRNSFVNNRREDDYWF